MNITPRKTTLLWAAVVVLVMASGRGFSQESANNVTMIGTLSCAHCQGIQPLHKGYTRWTWALHSVREGDDVVLVSDGNIYKLQGDKQEFLKYMEDKVKVAGNLKGQVFAVESLSPSGEK
jgi:hypothetical protein